VKELHIGTSSVPGLCILPRALAGYRKEAPEVNAFVAHSDSMDIIQQVENGTLDVGLVGRKTEGNCVFETIATDELVIAAPNNAYFREKYGDHVDLKELMKEPFIMRTEQSGTQYEAEQLLNKLGLSEKDLQIVAKVNDAHALQNYVIQGLGISLVSHRMVKAEALRGKMLVFPLGEYARQRSFYLVFQDGPYLPKSAIAFIRYMRELANKKDL
jgi:DNA-binding transcriptional LysR family regulator